MPNIIQQNKKTSKRPDFKITVIGESSIAAEWMAKEAAKLFESGKYDQEAQKQ